MLDFSTVGVSAHPLPIFHEMFFTTGATTVPYWKACLYKTISLFSASFVLAGMPSVTAEESQPFLQVEIPAELQMDYKVNADTFTHMFVKIEPVFALALSEHVSFNGGLVVEPVTESGADSSLYFKNHGLFAETLTVDFQIEGFHIYAGKFNPNFGLGFDLAPGIYGEDMPEGYELTERIGGGISYQFGPADTGVYRLGASSFFADTSFLSGSLITDRGQVSRQDGGVSNTGNLSSFVLSFDAEDVNALGGLSFHMAARRQTKGIDSDATETGLVAAINGAVPLADNVIWQPFAEYVSLWNVDGTENDRQYWTVSSVLSKGSWQGALSFSQQNNQCALPALCAVKQDSFQASVGYRLPNKVLIEAGYKYAAEDQKDMHILGIRLSMNWGFELSR